MSRADSGGFDLVLAVSPDYLRQRADDLLPDAVHPSLDYDRSSLFGVSSVFGKRVAVHLGLTMNLGLTLDEVVVRAGADGPEVTIGATARAWFGWDDVTLLEGDVLLGAGRYPADPDFDPTPDDTVAVGVSIGATIRADGHAVGLADLTATVTVPAGTLESLPPVAALLTGMRLVRQDWAADLLAWLGTVPNLLSGAVNALLPDDLPAIPLPFDDVRMGAVGSDVLAMVTISGGPGDPRAVCRSPIRHAADGSARDAVGLVVANALVLAACRTALSHVLPDAGFLAPHPCHWSGSVGIGGTHGVNVRLTWVLAQVDQTGALRLEVRFAGSDGSGGCGIDGAATVAAGVDVRNDRLVVTVDPPTITRLDVWVAWWVYALMAVGGGPIAVLATGLVDACAGGELAGDVNRMIGDHVPTLFEVPMVDLGVAPLTVSAAQPDAEWQFANVMPNGPAPVLLPVSRANDRIVVLVGSG